METWKTCVMLLKEGRTPMAILEPRPSLAHRRPLVVHKAEPLLVSQVCPMLLRF